MRRPARAGPLIPPPDHPGEGAGAPPALPVAAVAIDGGDLPLGGGLLALVRPVLSRLSPGAVLAVRSTARTVRDDLPSYCRVERHRYLERRTGPDGVDLHLLERGPLGAPGAPGDAHPLQPRPDGRLLSRDLLEAVPFPQRAHSGTGLAPRGTRVEPGGPDFGFDLCERELLAPPELGELLDQAAAAPWDASRDVPWSTLRPLPPALEQAVVQIMTFLAENELVALYVPSRFVARIPPAFAEVAQLLSLQMADEARHIDVFLKRAHAAGGGPDRAGLSTVTTARSLRSLLELDDFTEAAFLLSVLGEGTFLDLLHFIERHAPDEATGVLVRRARADEARHVHFGLAHVRHALAHRPALALRLEAAVRRRRAGLAGDAVPAPVADALTVLAAGGDDPPSIRRGHQAYQELLEEMHRGRIRRLQNAGFDSELADRLSRDHTPNFM